VSRILVSIIIPTFNSEETLDFCLRSVKEQTYRDIETIVVDNFSNDKTREIAERYKCRFYQIHGFQSRAKNYGAEMANGQYVLFLDSDEGLLPKTVERCVEICKAQDPDIIMLRRSDVGYNFWSRCYCIWHNLYVKDNFHIRFFKKSFFMRYKYNESLLLGDDVDLFRRVSKENIVYLKEVCFLHFRKSLKRQVIHSWRFGKVSAPFYGKYPFDNKKKRINRINAYIKLLKTLKERPAYCLGAIFLLTLRSIAWRIGRFTGND